jgi:hypothetical protein
VTLDMHAATGKRCAFSLVYSVVLEPSESETWQKLSHTISVN